ncbi:2-oxoglutarate dehydrogenase complex subunit, putative [Theileria annulata]|uniref:Dihydrolipoamide acetyltransferase component of pyruvate dehydrogenase complex n=1 Tax=Theileria annulata TaxID=5874 RepID=Q4U9K9_THEAN|nr:2-oxoglutarate dehydrogenase complex subunit, putative [Theileria annulata]CAI76494.1 2-oxoglutarate dehydrogenase complex subunit, putative [Theileria annulata]|eukprot:XP_953119.1 2-oxoglutarate dehydrogenase complex subunit, putative [Theileria annulata]
MMRLLNLYRLCSPCFSRPKTPCIINNFSSRFLHLSSKNLALTTFKLSDIGEGINEVQLVKWEKSVGDEVEEMESVCTVQSDKAAVEITSRYTGIVKKLYVNEGDTVKIGSPLMDIDTVDEVPDDTPNNNSSSNLNDPKRHYSTIPESKFFLNSLGTAKKSFSTSSTTQDDVEEVKVDFIGEAMVKSMVASLEVPHVTVGEECDVTSLIQLYKSYRNVPAEGSDQESQPKITITPFIIKSISLALEKVPIINSKFNTANAGKGPSSYFLYKNHNISVAINTKNGLMVPNIKNVNKLTIREIQRELSSLQQKANSKTLNFNDIKGGTCALSNLGSLGGTFVKARLFDGQAAIIAFGRSIQRVVPVPKTLKTVSTNLDDYTLECRSICNIGVTADHRHIDGAIITSFISHLKHFLENADSLRQYY